jgi:hypothetical protein
MWSQEEGVWDTRREDKSKGNNTRRGGESGRVGGMTISLRS